MTETYDPVGIKLREELQNQPERNYTRRVKAYIECNDGNTFIITTAITIKGHNLKECEDKIREQFKILLVRSLSSGVTVNKLSLL